MDCTFIGSVSACLPHGFATLLGLPQVAVLNPRAVMHTVPSAVRAGGTGRRNATWKGSSTSAVIEKSRRPWC